jgi:hypothetical protein
VPRLGIELDAHPTHTREGRIDVIETQEQPNAASQLIPTAPDCRSPST